MGFAADFKSFDTIFSGKARWTMVVLALVISLVSIALSASRSDSDVTKVQKFCGQVSVLNDSITAGRANNKTLYKALLTDTLARLNTKSERPGDRSNVTIYSNYINGIPARINIDCKVLG